MTDYGLPSFLCGQEFSETEADQYKRKNHSELYREAKKVSHYQIIKKSQCNLPTRLDFYVKLKYQSSTTILSIGNKYSMRDVLCDTINNAWPQSIDMRH